MYDVESDDYVYDLDMNNNDRPDSREDDPEPDYPYAEDLEGWHAIGTYRLTERLALSLGRLDSRQVHGGGANLMNYGRLSWSFEYSRASGSSTWRTPSSASGTRCPTGSSSPPISPGGPSARCTSPASGTSSSGT